LATRLPLAKRASSVARFMDEIRRYSFAIADGCGERYEGTRNIGPLCGHAMVACSLVFASTMAKMACAMGLFCFGPRHGWPLVEFREPARRCTEARPR